MATHGLSHSLSRISDYNVRAQMSHKRMGARTLSHHVFVTLGPWQWSSDTHPRLMRRSETHVPELDLRLAVSADKVSARDCAGRIDRIAAFLL